MRVLLAHNRYRLRGGEDVVFENEAALLEAHGHEVVRYEVSNDDVEAYGRVALARATLWNRVTFDEISALIAKSRPDVAHFHNTFPLLSPSGYGACRRSRVPVVQTLHNYRLLCPAATLFRDGGPCEACLPLTVKWPSVVHACYRDSRSATAVTAGMLAYHSARGTYRHAVDRYVALTAFEKGRFVAGGFDANVIDVKGNSTPDRGIGPGGDYALYVGRLAEEKGIASLLEAWSELGAFVELKIVGDGPLVGQVEAASARFRGVTYVGARSSDDVTELMKHAAFVVFPSIWYETFGLTIIEAYAAGTPVLASDLGAAAELVREGETGRLFAAGDVESLRSAAIALLRSDQAPLRANARRTYEVHHAPTANYESLLRIYEGVIATRS